MSYTDHASRIWLADCSKLAINQKNDNEPTICQHDITINFFWGCSVSFGKFSYWSQFHVNIGIGSNLLYNGLTRNLYIGNAHVWVFHNIWWLEQLRDTKFGMNVSNEMLLNTTKCQGCNFLSFWVIKGKSTGEIKSPPTLLPMQTHAQTNTDTPHTHTHTHTHAHLD